MRITAILITVLVLCGASEALAQHNASQHSPHHAAHHLSAEALTAELKLLREQVRQHPEDPQLAFRVGEVLRGLNRHTEAAKAYLAAGRLAPDMYIAYHNISVVTSDAELLDEAIQKLSLRLKEKPDELMLRVALSELYEKRGNYQLAARTLIDITYANKVPEKYKAKVSGRIHHLLALAKNLQQQETADTSTGTEEQLDVVPSPLPAQPSKRSIASARMKDSKEVKGVGKVPLLP
jgi:cytochrome c-type biogenesis protein CcmH/NrfG